MRVFRLEKFTKGWFVGDFDPVIVRTGGVEVAIKEYQGSDCEAPHHHRVATELTAVVSGRVKMFDQEFGAGDIVEVLPHESTGFQALTDAVTVVVKIPSVSNDKYLD